MGAGCTAVEFSALPFSRAPQNWVHAGSVLWEGHRSQSLNQCLPEELQG